VLVLEAFAGPRPDGMDALHRDDNPTNNRFDNLRWGTRSDNLFDAVRNGGKARGEKFGIQSSQTMPSASSKRALRINQCRVSLDSSA
jgi:hypothetical protein